MKKYHLFVQRLLKGLSLTALVAGAVMVISALWLPAKAWLAHGLISYSWQHYRATGQALKPWPWADTTAVGQLHFTRLAKDVMVLSQADNTALAFSAAIVAPFNRLESSALIAIAGHQDSHFSLLADVQLGDEILLSTATGNELKYRVSTYDIVPQHSVLNITPEQTGLVLITCYPFTHAGNGTQWQDSDDEPSQAQQRLLLYAALIEG